MISLHLFMCFILGRKSPQTVAGSWGLGSPSACHPPVQPLQAVAGLLQLGAQPCPAPSTQGWQPSKCQYDLHVSASPPPHPHGTVLEGAWPQHEQEAAAVMCCMHFLLLGSWGKELNLGWRGRKDLIYFLSFEFPPLGASFHFLPVALGSPCCPLQACSHNWGRWAGNKRRGWDPVFLWLVFIHNLDNSKKMKIKREKKIFQNYYHGYWLYI